MKEQLRNWLKRHSSLYCMLKFIRQFFNYDFRDYMLSYRYNMRWREFALPTDSADNGAINLPIYQKGNLNQDKIIYEIPLNSAAFGFCSQIMVLLNRINFADELGLTPCVNWYGSSLYKEKNPIRGTTNIFEYYFEPIQGITVKEAEESRFVVYDDIDRHYGFNWVHIPLAENAYGYSEEDLAHLGELMKKYFRLEKKVKRNIEKGVRSLLRKRKVLGVHGRGADMKLTFFNHPIYVSSYEYIEAAEKAMKEIRADCVFLATDDLEILESFKNHFGERLLYYKDVVRSPGRIHNALVEVKRERHHYKLGYEILRDVYTLACCDGFIGGMSYVNGVTRIIKKARGENFEYQKVIDKGRHKQGINVNDPNFLKNDAAVIQKLEEIQERKDISEEEQQAIIEQLLTKVYGAEEKSSKSEPNKYECETGCGI